MPNRTGASRLPAALRVLPFALPGWGFAGESPLLRGGAMRWPLKAFEAL